VDTVLIVIIFAVAAVVTFDFTNGFHDASNMIAVLIASRAMTPAQSVLLVGAFTFLGPILGGTAVADTIGSFVDVSALATVNSLLVVTCGIVGAIGWNLLTWWFALPSSSSHALVGGLVGAVLAGAGASDVVWGLGELMDGQLVGVTKIVFILLTSPIVGFAVGYLIHRGMCFLLRGAHPRVNRTLRRTQWITAAALAFAHGTNDAQKGMGIITMMLVLGGFLDDFDVPTWVIAASATSLTLGTLLGGWRIVRTVGFGIYKLRALHALDTQLTSSAVIFGASLIGGPVSTTHVVSTSIMGIGASERPRAVRWSKVEEIVVTWLLTIPGAAVLSAAAVGLLVLFTNA
jgi:PiT family inorganic phosphate transporter